MDASVLLGGSALHEVATPAGLVAVAAAVGAVLSLADPLPYVRDIVRGTTRPHRGTWLIWSVLGLVAFASQAASDGGWSLLVLGVQAASTLTVLALSIRRGVGGVSPAELALLGVAAAGIVCWMLSDDPAVALVCVVLADLVGALLMLPKTWRDPWSETASTFALTTVAGLLGAVAVGQLDPLLLLYPLYFATINGVTTLVIVIRRRTAAATPLPAPGPALVPLG